MTTDNVLETVLYNNEVTSVLENFDNPIHGLEAENVTCCDEQLSPHSTVSKRYK